MKRAVLILLLLCGAAWSQSNSPFEVPTDGRGIVYDRPRDTTDDMWMLFEETSGTEDYLRFSHDLMIDQFGGEGFGWDDDTDGTPDVYNYWNTATGDWVFTVNAAEVSANNFCLRILNAVTGSASMLMFDKGGAITPVQVFMNNLDPNTSSTIGYYGSVYFYSGDGSFWIQTASPSGSTWSKFLTASSGGATVNSFVTWATPAGTNPVADSSTDTVTFAQSGIITITGTAGTDTITIAATEADGSTTNELPLLSTDLGNNLLGVSTQTISLDNQSANLVFAGPTSGGAAAPAFRAIVDNDVPDNITVTEADTLQTVTGRGATTNVAVTLGDSADLLTVNGNIEGNDTFLRVDNGANGSNGTATGAGDLYVEDVAEIDGNLNVLGTASLQGAVGIGVGAGTAHTIFGPFSGDDGLWRNDNGVDGTNTTATGAGDFYAEDALEIDGNAVFSDAATDSTRFNGMVLDGDGDAGTVGQVLSSGGSNVDTNWIAAPAPAIGSQTGTDTTGIAVIEGGETLAELSFGTAGQYPVIDASADGMEWATPNWDRTLFDHYATIGNVGTGEDTLWNDTTPAANFDAIGEKIFFEYGGDFANNIRTKRLRLYGPVNTLIFDSGTLSVSAAADWKISGWIILAAIGDGDVVDGTMRWAVSANLTGASAGSFASTGTANDPGFGFGDGSLKLTGESGVGAANDDVTALLGTAWTKAAP